MHPLEAPEANVQQFVTKSFSREGFRPWSTLVTDASHKQGQPLLVTDGVRTYYHAWQVFRLAAFLRSGAKHASNK